MNARRGLALLLLAALAGCGQEAPPTAPEQGHVVRGAVSKGPLQGATVNFFAVDVAGNATGGPLVPPETTDAGGGFTVTGLPTTIPILVETSFGSYIDESDPETNPALKRRISFGGTDKLAAVLPPGAVTLAITPYSMAVYKKARIQAAGGNFANVYAAVGAQADSAFGFDPVLTVPADPTTGVGGSRPYGILLGAAALTVNQIAVTGTPEHLPAYADVLAFVDDFADGRLDAAPLALMVRRFRNNNIGVYGNADELPAVNETAFAQPAVVPNSAPTGAPAITGTATEDQTLTATAGTLADADGLGAFSYQWRRNASPIGLATASTYLLVDADVGAVITVAVSYTDGGGALESVTSAATAAVANVNDAPAGLPTISGTATENQTLTAVTGGISDADGLGTFSYQWNRAGTPVGGATASTYLLGAADVGSAITVTVSYTDGHGTLETLTSAATGAVTNVNDPPTGNAVVTGTATEDQTLTADTSGIADADGLGTFTYQWNRGGSPIGGATASIYLLGDADVGFTITVTVSYTDGGGAPETLTSAATAAVANVNDAPAGNVVIAGSASEGQTLTANTSGITDADGLGTFNYQWNRAGTPVGGATASTYLLGAADVGSTISVSVSYTDGGGTLETLTSAATGAVTNVNDPPTGNAVITGTATEDQTLTADTSGIADTDGLGAFNYQWNRAGTPIGSATASTYLLVDGDVGFTITVTVSYTDGGGTPETLTSAATAAVTNVNDAPTGNAVITGTATEDQTLAVDTSGIADADGLGVFSYQWNRSGSPIGGATASTYLLVDADVGSTITITVSYTDGHGTLETLTSAATAAVANVNDAPAGNAVITGTATEGQTLTADTSSITDADGLGTFSYQWNRAGSPIGGATASTYLLINADVGFTITVTASYTDGGGTLETLTSAATAAVANVNDPPTGNVVITGTATEDQTLTADTSGIADADGLGPFSYQWNRGGSPIGGATASTYLLGDADVGFTITVTVSYTDGGGTPEILTSAATGTVANVNDTPVVVTNAGASVDEGLVAPIGNAELLTQDVDNAPAELTYNVSPGPTNGFLQFMGIPVPIFSFTQADVDNGFISYQHDGSETVSDSFDFAVTDTGAPPMSSAVETFTIMVNGLNDAPSVALPVVPVAMNQATAIEPITVSDADAGAANVSLTLSVLPVGTLTVKTLATGGVIPDAQVSGNGTDTVIVTATLADLNATFGAGNDGLLLDVGAAGTRYTGPVTIDADLDDLGNSGTGGALTANDFEVLNVDHFELATLAAGDASASTGITAGELAGRSIAGGGDFNGDGYDDYVIGAPQANGGAGAVYVVFGGPGGLPPAVDLTTLNGTNGFRVDGANGGDRTGTSVALNGDYTNDGFDDLLIGSDGADRAHAIYGRSVGIQAVYSLGTSCTPASPDLAITGEGAGAQTGFAVAYAGDVNGDGADDLLVGAPGAASGAGAAYVLFGFMPSDPFLFPPNVLVGPCSGTPSFDVTFLDGSFGFAVGGLPGGDRAGYAVAGGDVNGDSFDDILVGAPTDPLAPTGPGRAFVVFGHTGSFPALVNLGALNGGDGAELASSAAGERAGISVAVGDISGDGIGEMIVGADRADPAARGDEGAAYVVHGATGAFPPSIDLTTLDGSNGFVIAGAAAGDNAGAQVASAGDVNGDGFGDLLVGAPLADPNGQADAGQVSVFYGTGSSPGTIFDLAFVDGINGFHVNGAIAGDTTASAGIAGDLNGDGFDEIHVGAASYAGGTGRGYTVFGYDYRRMAASIGSSASAGGFGAILIGSPGADTLDDGSFSGTVLKGGAGDDALLVTPLNPLLVDGGTGDDVLVASTGELDLTVITGPGRYYRSEGVVLNGDASLRVDALDVLRVSELDFLTVNGGTIAPQPVVSASAWLREGFDDGSGLAHYRNGYARLEVFDGLNRDGIPVAFQWAASSLPGNAASSRPSLSGTGALMAFESTADNLVGSPTVPGGVSQIYLRGLGFGGTTTVISQSGGVAGSADSTDAVVSYDGRYIAFRTSAPEILGSVPPGPQVVLHDTVAGTFQLVSNSCGGGICPFDSTRGRISLSADARYVAFIGRDSPGNTTQVWRMDLQTATLVSPSVDGGERCGTSTLPDACYSATMSGDGRWIAWSTPNDTLGNDTNGVSDVFLRDMQSGQLRLVSATGGVSPPQASAQPWISADGRRLAFESNAALVAGDGNAGGDIYVYDISSQLLARASTNATGDEGAPGFVVNDVEDEEGMPVLSGDGRLLAFTSTQSDLAPAVPSGSLSMFVKALDCSSCTVAADGDLQGELLRGHLNRDAGAFNATSTGFAMGFDGRVIAMQSDADNVVGGDANGARDVFAGLDPLHSIDFTLDSDGDGLTNADEMGFIGSNPLLVDTDGDGLSDGDEYNTHFTDPRVADTDSDGVADGLEIGVGSDAFTANTVVYVDPTAGCSAACDGTSWATAWPNEFNVEGSNNISGPDGAGTVYVFFRDGTGYGSLDLTSVDRKHVAYIGSMGPGFVKPRFPPTTNFSAGGSERALHITQAVALVVANLRFEGGFDSALGGGVLLEAPLNGEFTQNLVTLRNVEIANNDSDGAGGGVAASGASNFLQIEGSSVTGNQAQGIAGTAQGGGVLALNGAQVSVTDSQISGNSVTCGSAGCAALGGGAAASGAGPTLLTLDDSIVENNSAFTGGGAVAAGGGLAVDGGASLEVRTSEVRSNTANGVSTAMGSGGGIAIAGADALVEDSAVRSNTASAQVISPPLGGGGGIYGDASAQLAVRRSIIADNKATAGPGGGINLVDSAGVAIEDSKFLSNSSLNPGGGLHVHPQALTSIFNNLFVGNVATDAAAEGGAMELDVTSGSPGLFFESNTVAYNQTRNSAGAGGGISIKSSPPASLALNNNNIWFNQDNSPVTQNPGDNYLASGGMAVAPSGNNVNEASLTTGNLSPPTNPAFVQGFYLDPILPSPSVDAGDNTFAGPLVSPPYTTSPDGTADSVAPAVDIGFHHRQASSGSFDAVALTPSRSVSCASSDTFFFTPRFANAPNGEPGHLIVVELSGVTPALGSLSTLDPRLSGSRVARDLGDGRYAVATSGFHSGAATGTFTVYADEQPTPQTFALTFTNGC